MLEEQKIKMVAVVLKILNNEPLSSQDFNLWLQFVTQAPIIEQLNIDQAQQLMAQARATLANYGKQQQR